jgi:putative transposase
VDQMCCVLEVSRSGYYAARRRSRVQPTVCEASVQLKAAVASRRVAIGIYRSRRLMRQHGLRSAWKRKFVHTTDSKHALPISPNVLDRQFDPTRPNQTWLADITYIRTRSGWLYQAVVLDLFARKVVGWGRCPEHSCRSGPVVMRIMRPSWALVSGVEVRLSVTAVARSRAVS